MNEQEPSDAPEEIAIVGLTGRFPGAPDLTTFWQNLREGRETISRFPEWEREGDPSLVGARGLLDGAEKFDAAFFGMTPNEALITDPQHRVFLECAWEALESAGVDPARYPGSIGVYAGMSNNSYFQSGVVHRPDLQKAVGALQTMMGNEKDYLATRTAYKLNLKGPAISLYTACSTSLVAVCQACAALLSYQCDLALAGGVSVTFPQARGYRYEEGGILSPDGHCRTFDVGAQGTVFSSGVGVVALKRLSEALADGDTIHAVIKGAALNNDGDRKVSFTAPSVDGHAEVIALAHALAGITPDSLSYIEAHGTATPLGDPIELAGLTQAFRASTDEVGFCAIGSVKTNIGHLDAAAGIAGLIKTVLALKHKELPPSLHFTAPNPKLELETSPFVVNTKLQPWETRDRNPRRAGVSSFGVGGTNAHVIVEEAPQSPESSASRQNQLLTLSAKTASALDSATENLVAHLEAHPASSLADVAYTLQTGRHRFAHRRVVVAETHAEAASLLREKSPKRVFSGEAKNADRSIAFLFPGQGVQAVNMGRALYETESVFRDSLDASAEILRPTLGLNLRTVLYPAPENEAESQKKLTETYLTQPSLFAVEYALAQLWRSWGVLPDALLGHSVGEYVCACLAGVFSHEDGLTLLARRARLMQDLPAGSMLAARLPEAELLPFLTPEISLAAVNAPGLCVASGPTPAIEALERALGEKKIVAKKLPTSHAFHSAMLDPILPAFRALFDGVRLHAPEIPYVSSRTGTWIEDSEATDSAYWAGQLRDCVRFADGVETLLQDPNRLALEVGPGQSLAALVRQHPAKSAGHAVVSSLPAAGSARSEDAAVLDALGQLWIAGVEPDADAFWGSEARRKTELPSYPFERQPYLLEAPTTEPAPIEPMETSPVSSPTPNLPERKTRLLGQLTAAVSDLSGFAPETLAANVTFVELGFDSLFLTQIAGSLTKKFGQKITFRQLLEDLPTLDALAAHLDSKLPPEPVAVAVAPQPSPAPQPPVTGEPAQSAPIVNPPIIGGQGVIPIAAPDGSVQQIVQQQLALMAEQLRLLQGGAVSLPPAPLPAPQPPVMGEKLPSSALRDEGDGGRGAGGESKVAHGPYRPVSRDAGALSPEQLAAIQDLVRRYNARTPGSKRLTQEGRARLADPRAVAGFKQVWKDMVYPIVTERSQGARLWDVDGNEYLDLTLGFGTNFLGHRPPFVVSALENQLKLGMEIGPQSPLAARVAKKLCELVGAERAAFCNTGSEAVTAAIRMARTVTGRDKIALFSGAYHGQFDEVLVRAAGSRSLPVAPGIPDSMVENVLVLEYGTPESLEAIRSCAHELAAVLIEPVQSRRPDFQPEAFVRELRKITEESGTALVFDEVVTGFRTHPGGVQARWGIRGDMATYGKVLGGGIPIGVVTGKAKWLDALDGGDWSFGDDSFPEVGMTFFAGTFVRHPLALASADAVLNHLIEQGPSLQQNLDRRTEAFVDKLNGWCEEVGAGVHLTRFSSCFYVNLPGDWKHASLLFYHLRLRGLHLWEGRPGFLSTAHTDEDVDNVLRVFQESIGELQDAGFLPGSARIEKKSSPLTDAQREVWLASRMDENASLALNESLSIHLRGPLDRPALDDALQALVARHESLRTTFDPLDGTPRVAETLKIALTPGPSPVRSSQARTEEGSDSPIIGGQGVIEGQLPFDLENGPLIRATLVPVEQEHHVLVLTAHHLVCDGWSFGVLLNELGELYSGERLPAAPRFSEYAAAQNADPEREETETYWAETLTPLPAPLELPTDRPHPAIRSFRGARVSQPLDAEIYDGLRAFSKKHGATLFTTLLTGLGTLLSRLTGQSDFVLGVPAAGQATDDAPELVGHCVHLLPLRLTLDADATFCDALKRVRTTTLDAFERPRITFGSLLERLNVPREAGRTPLVSVTFNLDRDDLHPSFAGLEFSFEKNPRSFFQFDLGFNLVETDAGMALEANYNAEIFDESTVQRWLGHYRTLLAGIVAAPETTLGALPVLTDAEKHKILVEWNDTATDFPENKSVPELFAEQVAKSPNAIAVQSETETLTYAELDVRSDAFAADLVERGAAPGKLVGVCLERGPALIVALLAVLKTGAAYVPLDPAYPAERLKWMQEDSGAAFVVTSLPNPPFGVSPTSSARREGEVTSPFPHADEVGNTLREGARGWVLDEGNAPAYVMYTSGSTGMPKGSVIPHRAIARLVKNTNYAPLGPGDVVAQLATPAFDAATFEIWGALLNGATLWLFDKDLVLSPRKFAEALKARKVSALFLTVALFNELIREVPDALSTVKYAMFGGDAASPLWVRKALEAGPPQNLINGYGPTETTTFAATYRVTEVPEGATSIPIGKPIANTTLYVLDSNLQPVPVGVPGELYIGGPGVALGYHCQPERTAERFLDSPFFSGERLYKTGDRVKFLPDGNIDFLGRFDNQVKIRGFRIEPGEVEAALASHPSVTESLVLVREDAPGEKRLVAYVVGKTDGLRDYLSERLPSYLVPSAFVSLESFPITANGKVDRAALPRPEGAPVAGQTYVAPSAELEERLARLWAEVLGVEKVGVHDGFFEIGGHSLLAVRLFALIEAELGKRLSLSTLFAAPTIARQAALLGAAPQFAVAPNPPGASPSYISLVPLQPEGNRPRLYCVHHGYGDLTGYHDLVKNLGTDQPLWGFQARGIQGIYQPVESIAEMARNYVGELRTLQPTGPYHLTGFSLGGVIAFEMARQLRASGQEVGLLALLDTYAPIFFHKEEHRGNLLAELADAASTLRRIAPEDRWAFTRNKSRVAGSRIKALFTRSEPETGTPEELRLREAIGRVEAASRKALREYVPSDYAGDAVIFRAQEQEIQTDYDPVLWWRAVLKGHVTVKDVPGDHHAIIQEPGVRELARLLRECLDAVAVA